MSLDNFVFTTERAGIFGLTEAGQTTITYKRLLSHSVEQVCQAITDLSQLSRWFPELTVELKKDGDVVIGFSDADCPPPGANPEDVDYCTVTADNPPDLIKYIGSQGGLRWELTGKDDQCELTLVAFNPPDRGPDYSILYGWHEYADVLEWYLDGISFEDEGYAGSYKMKLYEHYKALKIPEFQD